MPSVDRVAARGRGARAPRRLGAVAAALLLAGCGTFDDLSPSGADRSQGGAAGTEGPSVGQTAPDFALLDTAGLEVTLSGALAGRRAAVLYFVMWCPICDADMSDMLDRLVPAFPDVAFIAIDYVSGSVAAAQAARQAAGWGGDEFHVLVDPGAAWKRYYSRDMGVVVVDAARVVRMNQDYDGPRVQALLGSLP